MKGIVSNLVLAAAILVAALVALIYIRDRNSIARNEAAKAVCEEEIAAANAREADASARQAKDKARQAADDLKRAEIEAENLKQERENAKLEAKNLEETRKLAEIEAETAANRKAAAAAERVAREAALKNSSNLLAIEEKKTRQDEMKLKVAERQKDIEELKALQTRHSLEELNAARTEYERKLAEIDILKEELEELKKAATPDVTVSDLMSVQPEDEPPPVEEAGKSEVEAVMKDRNDNIPIGRRSLGEIEDLVQLARSEAAATNREMVVKALRQMMETAISEKRAIDAMFYEKTIKGLYPDWRYFGPDKDGPGKEDEVQK